MPLRTGCAFNAGTADPHACSSSGSASSKRKQPEPTGPKAAQTAYFLFLAENRAKLTAEQPNLPNKDRMAALAKLWKGLTEEEKQVYQDLAVKDKERYVRECKEAGIETADEKRARQQAEAKKQKAAADAARTAAKQLKAQRAREAKEHAAALKAQVPKKLSSYFIFCSEQRYTVINFFVRQVWLNQAHIQLVGAGSR